MGLHNNCCDIYNTNLTKNDLCNVEHYKGKEPFGDYNALGELQGYFWYYGETINLNFSLDGAITVENDAIVYVGYGEEPTSMTVGYQGQRAYNVVDLKSWTCAVAYPDTDTYTWVQDQEFTYPLNGGRTIYVTPSDYLQGKKMKVNIYNFRRELFYSRIMDAKERFSINIDQETSKMFTKGTYYLTLQVFDDSALLYLQVIKDKECTLTVR